MFGYESVNAELFYAYRGCVPWPTYRLSVELIIHALRLHRAFQTARALMDRHPSIRSVRACRFASEC